MTKRELETLAWKLGLFISYNSRGKTRWVVCAMKPTMNGDVDRLQECKTKKDIEAFLIDYKQKKQAARKVGKEMG